MNLATQAERSVLGGILLTCDTLPPEVESLSPGDFADAKHSAVFAAMRRLCDQGEPIDYLTLRPLVESVSAPDGGWGPYLARLSDDTPTAANIGYHAEIVRRESRRRAFVQVMLGAVRDAQKPGADSESILGAAVTELGRIAEGMETVRPAIIREVVRDECKALETRVAAKEIPGLPTGFPELDDTLGGLHPGNLVIIAARPAMGKSSLARNILAHVTGKELKRGILFSFEMTREEIGQAMLASEGSVSLSNIRSGRLSDADFARLTRAMNGLHHDRMAIVDKPYLCINDIRSITRQFAARGGCDLVVVDYLQLISGEGHSREQEIAGISRGLKTLAMELKVPVVALSQLNRGLESRPNKRPVLSDLRDSGSIEQDANQVLFVFRDEYYNEKSTAKGEAEICIAKNRNGPAGVVKLRWVGKYTRFQSMM